MGSRDVCLPLLATAAAGPAPATGGGTEEVPEAGPGGGPPPDAPQLERHSDGS